MTTATTINDPVLLGEAAGLIRRNEFSARRDIRDKGALIDRRASKDPVSIPARRLGQAWTVNRADLKKFERLVYVDGVAPATAGRFRELGLVVYTGYEGDTWVAVGNIWPLITLSASKPGICSVSPVSDGDGEQMLFRAEVEVLDRTRFLTEMRALKW